MFKSFNHKPDIILMDHRMPVKDGIEATKEIFNIDQKVKVIFASADMSIKEIALSMGIVGFLSKPFSLEKLVKKIESIISKEAVKSHA
jgi:CheY-like chemotaxis protein